MLSADEDKPTDLQTDIAFPKSSGCLLLLLQTHVSEISEMLYPRIKASFSTIIYVYKVEKKQIFETHTNHVLQGFCSIKRNYYEENQATNLKVVCVK